YDSADEFLREISWSQPAEKVYQVEILLNEKQQWGFDASYEGNDLILEIMKPPAKLSLKNLFIGLDPGHGPDEGAIGPTRLTERDANLQTAEILKKKLEEKGARVFLTRHDRHGITLAARARVAALLQPDLLVSLHYNALPDGVDPFRNRGSSTYYYQPQSRALAVAIQKRMVEKLKLANYGLFYDNLAICRVTQMPVVLVEPAFIMHPEEEMLIRNKKFMEKTADAIVKGIEDFLKQARE
ncbi:MAG: N-acetylmuramoyl-L-alanine amidase, partial [Calditrichaeota bacterium]